MLHQRLNNKKCKELQQVIFDYLHSDNKRQARSCFDRSISSLEEQALFPSTQPQQKMTPAKPKKQRQVVARICFKNIFFNDISIQRHSISLSITKKRQPDMEISFTLEGRKCKLSIPPSKDNASIIVTLSNNLVQVQAKSAFYLEYGGQSEKQKWNLRQTHANLKIRANYLPKRYDQSAIETYFIYNNINFVITDPAPTKKLANSQANSLKDMKFSMIQSSDKAQFPLLDFMMPIDPHEDKPIILMLSHLNDTFQQNTAISQAQLTAQREIQQQSQKTNKTNHYQSNFNNRQQTKVQQIQDNSLTCQKIQQVKTQNQYQFQENYEQSYNLECNFRVPSSECLVQTSHDKMDILNLEFKEKKAIITDIFKIKKFRKSDYSINQKKIPCPINSCDLVCTEVNELREHLYSKHKELNKHGIKVDAEGKLKYSQKSLNYVLYLARLYPNQIKKVIKKMKLKV